MDLVIFRLGITMKARLGGKLGRQAWEATGGNGFGNFRAGNHYWDTLGGQLEATGDNGFSTFRTGNHHWGTLGRQRKAMDLVTFWLGITTEASLGGELGRQREAMDLVIFVLGVATRTHLEDNGRQW